MKTLQEAAELLIENQFTGNHYFVIQPERQMWNYAFMSCLMGIEIGNANEVPQCIIEGYECAQEVLRNEG